MEIARVVDVVAAQRGTLASAAEAMGDVHDEMSTVLAGSNDDDMATVVTIFGEARDTTRKAHQQLHQAVELLNTYLVTLGIGGAGTATPQPIEPAAEPAVVRHADGSHYPAEAAWAVHLLPRRVRSGAAGERTVGYVAGSPGSLVSGIDGSWTPEIESRLATLGVRAKTRARLRAHVEMKAVVLVLREGRRHCDVVINHMPCGARSNDWGTGCHQILSRVLPKGCSMTVHGTTQDRESFTWTYEGNAG